MKIDFEQMPRDALIRELRKRVEADIRINSVGDADPNALVLELHLYQIELEMQNRELVEAQLALEDSRARYADLYNHAPVAIVSLDVRGIIRELNVTGAAMLGASRQKLLGTDFGQLVEVGERSRFWTHLRRALSEDGSVTTQLTLQLGDRKLDVQLSGATTVEDGTLSCRTSLVDITELKQAERRLRLLSDAGQSLGSSLDYRSTLGAVTRLAVPLFADACVLDLLGEDGVLQRLEVAATDRAAAQDVLRGASAHPGESGPQRAALSSGRAALFERRPDAHGNPGHQADALWDLLRARTMIVVPVRARDRILGALTFVTSTSGRRFVASDLAFAEELARRAAMALDNALLYHQAQRAVRARENLLAIVSHDLQNPLTIIMLRAESLLTATIGDSCVEDAEAIRRAAHAMHGLIDDLLDLASMDAGTLSMCRGPCSLDALIDEAVELLEPLAMHCGVAIVRGPPIDAPAVSCDRDRIMQVLTNLLGNALKFTPRGGTITVSASAVEGEGCVTVTDTGCGITEEQLPHIFDRYWRAEPMRRAGTGLGLSICKAIIDAHGARIGAASVAGQGATFYFALPFVTRTST